MSETTRRGPPRPLVIARGGASAEAPENTIAAFELAVERGADSIQLPVHLSRDEHPVVIADVTLARTTGAAGRVGERTVRELKRLDAGSWRGEQFRGQRIQTLQEVFERFRDRAGFCVELRGETDQYPALDERVLSTIEIYDVLDRTVVQSSEPAVLARLRDMNPEVRLGFTGTGMAIDAALAASGPAEVIAMALRELTDDAVLAIRADGRACYAWTVSEPAQVDRLIGLGVGGLITDKPGLVRARLVGQATTPGDPPAAPP